MKRAGSTIILISLLAAAGLWLQPAPRPRAPEAEPPPARTLDPRDAAHLLERFLALHEKTAGDRSGARLDRERRTGVTEARLLALALPETVGPLLEQVAADAARPEVHREFAIRILGFLPDNGDALARLAPRSPSALRMLARRDPRGEHLPLYLASGDAEAISHWTDPAAVALMKKLAATSDDGRRMAERHDLLLSADWAQRLEELLRDPCHERGDLTLWALHAARARALPGLASTLRDRLDQAIPDPFRDDVLVALAELGGLLTDDELRRLESFGYVGDPAALLGEFLAIR